MTGASKKQDGRFSYAYRGERVSRTLKKNPNLVTEIARQPLDARHPDAESSFDLSFLRGEKPLRKPRPKREIRAVDLFCGCGGLTLGAVESAASLGLKLNICYAIDNDPETLKVYERNFPGSRTLCCDIRSEVNEELGAHLSKKEERLVSGLESVELVLAGPPCQGHSDLNNHTRRDDKRNILYERVARFVEIAAPSYVVIENVPTVVHGRQRSVQKSIAYLQELGYEVDNDFVDLSEIGVPQTRKRHVLLASRRPIPSIKDMVKKHRVSAPRTLEWAIMDLPAAGGDSAFTKPSRHTQENIRRMKYLIKEDVYDLPDKLRPRCHRNSNHTYKSMYGRLRKDRPAQTITSGFTSPGQGRYVHPDMPRTLTPHEAARLQFFPDSFDFEVCDKRTSLSDMIGNAVPMKLSFAICTEIFVESYLTSI